LTGQNAGLTLEMRVTWHVCIVQSWQLWVHFPFDIAVFFCDNFFFLLEFCEPQKYQNDGLTILVNEIPPCRGKIQIHTYMYSSVITLFPHCTINRKRYTSKGSIMLEVLAGLMISCLPDVHTNVFCAVNMSGQSKQFGLVLVLCQIKSDTHCQGCREGQSQ